MIPDQAERRHTRLLVTGLDPVAARGQRVDEENWLVQAARFIEASGEHLHEVELHRVSGDFLNATGDRSAAEQLVFHIFGALAEFERLGLLCPTR